MFHHSLVQWVLNRLFTHEPSHVESVVYDALIKLCVDICKRNGKKKLLWFADKDKSLNYAPKSDEMVITVHRWFANKSCPGNWLYARLGDVAARVTANLGSADTPSKGTQATGIFSLQEIYSTKSRKKLLTNGR